MVEYRVSYTKAKTGQRFDFNRHWDNKQGAKAFARSMNEPNSQGEKPIKNARPYKVKRK